MREAGFEPAHPEIVGLKSTALDHSAIRAKRSCHIFIIIAILPPFRKKNKKLHLHYIAFTHSKNSKNKRMI